MKIYEIEKGDLFIHALENSLKELTTALKTMDIHPHYTIFYPDREGAEIKRNKPFFTRTKARNTSF